MDMVNEAQKQVGVHINDEYCSRCFICSSLCPFDAIRKDPETDKMVLDIEKCQTCGLCYSSCPAQAIDIIYYDMNSLTRYLERAKQEYASDTLMIMCKGCAPETEVVEKIFGISKFVPLSVPCVGRVPENVFLKAISALGMKKIYVLACEEDYCRFERGSSVATRKILALNLLLEQLGYGKPITLRQNSLKVTVNKDKCIACGNCAYHCPYGAATLISGTADIDEASCHGCGLCVSLCPAFALELDYWEGDRISAQVSSLMSGKAKPKFLVFRCQWSVFPSLIGTTDPDVGIIELPCAGRVDALHVLEALDKGAEGVMIAACPEEDCKSETGSKEAERSITALKKTLSQIGLDEKLHFYSVSPRYPGAFDDALKDFKEKLANPSKETAE